MLVEVFLMPDYQFLYELLCDDIRSALIALPADSLAAKMLLEALRRCGELERGCEDPAVIWGDSSRQALQRLAEFTGKPSNDR